MFRVLGLSLICRGVCTLSLLNNNEMLVYIYCLGSDRLLSHARLEDCEYIYLGQARPSV